MTLWYAQPASRWQEALPVGNGTLGGMVWGGVQADRVDLNIDTLWSGKPRQLAEGDHRGDLSALRAAVLDERDYVKADQLARRLQGPFNEAYQPLGTLTLTAPGLGAPGPDYQRRLDLDNGVASSVDGPGGWQREVFASFPHQVIVYRVGGGTDQPIHAVVGLSSLHPATVEARGPAATVLYGRAPVHAAPPYHPEPQSVIYDEQEGMRFAVQAMTLVGGGRVELRPDGSIEIAGAEQVTILVAATTAFAGWDRAPEASVEELLARTDSQLHAAAAMSFAELRTAHAADVQAAMSGCRLTIGTSDTDRAISARPTDERLERAAAGEADEGLVPLLWQYGRYLLVSSSRPGSQAANLQGIWSHEVQPPWSSNWTVNINTQMNYWHAETTDLAACHQPLLAMVEDLSSAGAPTACTLYDCGGWVTHHNVDLWRSTWPVGSGDGHPVWSNWPMAGPWLCQHLWERYDFSLDLDYLRRTAYPVLRGAAEFVLDFLVERDGLLTTCPSTSPENLFSPAPHVTAAVSAGSAMDRWLIRDLLTHVVEAARLLAEDQGEGDDELTARACAALQRLPLPAIGADGRIQEWWEPFEEVEPGHRHLSHLWGLYPGDEVSPLHTPELAEAVRRSLEYRLEHGGGATGWSRAWVIALWARLHQGGQAHAHLRNFLAGSVGPNLFGLHPPGLFQIDANFGATAAITEMLLQSHGGEVHFLPALPDAWAEGEVIGLRARGGIRVDIRWSGNHLRSAHLELQTDAPVRLRFGADVRLADLTGGDQLNDPQAAHGTVTISPTGDTLDLSWTVNEEAR